MDRTTQPDVRELGRGSVLTLLDQATRQVTTLAATLNWWVNGGVREAIRRLRPGIVGDDGGKGNDWDDTSTTLVERVQVDWPHRFRIHAQRQDPTPPYTYTLLTVDHGRWLAMFGADLARSSGDGPDLPPPPLGVLPELIDPSQLIADLEFDDNVTSLDHGGIPAVRIEGRPRRTGRVLTVQSHTLARGADRYEIVLHAELGIALTVTSVLDNRAIMRVSLSDLVVGLTFQDNEFSLDPPEGVHLEIAPSRSAACGLPARQADRTDQTRR